MASTNISTRLREPQFWISRISSAKYYWVKHGLYQSVSVTATSTPCILLSPIVIRLGYTNRVDLPRPRLKQTPSCRFRQLLMFHTNDRSISLLDKPLNIEFHQFSTLGTIGWLECRTINPISLKIETIGSIKNNQFQTSKMLATFRAFAPITGLIVMLLFVKSAQRVFPMTARTNVENVRRVLVICWRVAHRTIAAFGSHKRALFSTETAIST